MNRRVKPVVVVSKCLGFDACRYNGDIIEEEFLKRLEPFVRFVPVCPEMEIGLGTPREPVRIVNGNGELKLLQPATGLDLTERMRAFSSTFLASLKEVDGFILKSRSPSCGPAEVKVYKSTERGAPVAWSSGLFAGAVLEKFPGLAVEDEGRLRNYKIREHFLTRLFALARFREMRKGHEMRNLVQLHASNKLLLMAYHQNEMRTLGRLVANPQRRRPREVWADYAAHFGHALARAPRHTSIINVMQHAFGYFSQRLTAKERSFFLSTLEKYRKGRIPVGGALSVLTSWIVRFEDHYLSQQTFFDPYPAELMDVTDSGKGRSV